MVCCPLPQAWRKSSWMEIFWAAPDLVRACSADVVSVRRPPASWACRSLGALDGRISAAKAAAGCQSLTLSEMRLSLWRGSRGRVGGHQNLDRLLVSGTLATNELKLSRFWRARLPWSIKRRLERRAFRFEAADSFDLDQRVSAARIKWRGHPLADAAIELMNKDGRLTATLVEASAYSGPSRRNSLSRRRDPALRRMRPAASPTPTSERSARTSAGRPIRAGRRPVRVRRGRRYSLAGLAHALQGKATIQLAPGVVDGLSFEEGFAQPSADRSTSSTTCAWGARCSGRPPRV